MVELKDFVSQTLTQIIDGVMAAQEHAAPLGAKVNPYEVSGKPQNIEFDIAVTVEESTKGEAGAGFFVAPISLGARGQSEVQSSAISRVKFLVPMMFPTQKLEKYYPKE